MKTRTVCYQFDFDDQTSWRYELQFDAAQRFLPVTGAASKDWTKLEFQKCPHCPLKEANSPHCPVARSLDAIVEDSKNTLSCTRATVTVATPERTYQKKCDTQEGLRSLFGLMMASSGCPHLDWLRPMARFHLPFADIEETLYRSLSVELLHLYFESPQRAASECSASLEKRYANVQTVNHAFIRRIRTYCQSDADKNAIAALDVFTQMFSFQMEGNFGEIRKYFSAS